MVVVEITIPPQVDCQSLIMKQQGVGGRGTKAEPRTADVDAASCLLCGGVCEVDVVHFCLSIIVCRCQKAYLHISARVYCVLCASVSVSMCVSAAALWL